MQDQEAQAEVIMYFWGIAASSPLDEPINNKVENSLRNNHSIIIVSRYAFQHTPDPSRVQYIPAGWPSRINPTHPI
jgi:hypothetical protein